MSANSANSANLSKLSSVHHVIRTRNAARRPQPSYDFPSNPSPSDETMGSFGMLGMSMEMKALLAESDDILREGAKPSLGTKLINFTMATIRFILKYMPFIILALVAFYGGAGTSTIATASRIPYVFTAKYWTLVGSLAKFNAAIAVFIVESFTKLLGTIAIGYIWCQFEKGMNLIVFYPCFAVIWTFMSLFKGMKDTIRGVARMTYRTKIPDAIEPPTKGSTPKTSSVHDRAARQAMRISKLVISALSFIYKPADRWMKILSWTWNGYWWYNKAPQSSSPKALTPKQAEEAYDKIMSPKASRLSPMVSSRRSPSSVTPVTPVRKTMPKPTQISTNGSVPYISRYPSYKPQSLRSLNT